MKKLTTAMNQMVSRKMKIGNKEVVPEGMVEDAMDIVKFMYIETQHDVLTFCTAMNLLNTYVKQKDSTITYGFKKFMNHLFLALLRYDIPGVKIGIEMLPSRNALVFVQIDDLQFSFHEIVVSGELIDLICDTNVVTEVKYDGLRKQMCAVSLYKMAC